MFSLIFLLVIALYLSINYLFVSSIFTIFSFIRGFYFYLIFLISVLLPIISMFLHRMSSDSLGKWIYLIWISYAWIVLISNYIFLIYRLIDIKYHNNIFWYISLIIAILLILYSFYLWRSIVVKEINISNPKLNENIKIAYMSDIHIDTLNDEKYIAKIASMVNEINPDIVLINWDLVDGTSLTHAHFAGFDEIKAPIYATLWNHEEYMWVNYVEDLLSKTKIKLLKNQKVEFKDLQILASDEIWARSKNVDLKSLDNFLSWAQIDEKKASLLLVHEPVWMSLAEKYWVDLQVAWHTHDWQIWPFWYIAKQVFWYTYWLYNIWNMKFYISSWTGLWWPPFRLGTRNEIVVINMGK